MNRSMYATVVVVVALVLVVGVVVEAAPAGDGRIDEGGVAAFRRSLYGPGRSPERRANNQCSSNARKQYVCELCAKQTKSLQVYTLCCDGIDNAQTWCESFIGFGITGV
ncbi:uncharacterized protein [Penaeus vannamei]|uniref:uncharacterized protein n=1 Tax=Penaeus vannamei TaxID=6689 RepID=UPI001FB64A0B|nr:uncharacterized protein LOC125044373 [Penaeus chinensis]XP_047496966.1 uncharacterized protein LOC125044373 [Penaeus chinensis]